MIVRFVLIFIALATGCSTKSPEYFLQKARAVNCELLQELQNIEDLEGLIAAMPVLQKQFDRLVDVMIEARSWQLRHKTSWGPTEKDNALSLELAHELARIYQMPTAKQLIEKCQEPALIRLDAFEKKNNSH